MKFTQFVSFRLHKLCSIADDTDGNCDVCSCSCAGSSRWVTSVDLNRCNSYSRHPLHDAGTIHAYN